MLMSEQWHKDALHSTAMMLAFHTDAPRSTAHAVVSMTRNADMLFNGDGPT